VWLWDVSDPAHPRRLGQALTTGSDDITAVAFTSDGHTVISSGPDGTAVAWNVTDPVHAFRLADLRVPSTDGVLKVAFSADASTMVTVGSTAVSRWDLRALIARHNRPFDQACGFAGGGFSRDDWAGRVPDVPYVATCPA
jgi:WD40 repeat protein